MWLFLSCTCQSHQSTHAHSQCRTWTHQPTLNLLFNWRLAVPRPSSWSRGAALRKPPPPLSQLDTTVHYTRTASHITVTVATWSLVLARLQHLHLHAIYWRRIYVLLYICATYTLRLSHLDIVSTNSEETMVYVVLIWFAPICMYSCVYVYLARLAYTI